MATLTVSEIKDYVKTCLDEMSNTSDAALVTNDQSAEELDTIIVNAIVPAVRKIHLDAPNVLLKEGKSLKTTAVVITPGDQPMQQQTTGTRTTQTTIVLTPSRVEFGPEGGTKKVTVQTVASYEITTSAGEPAIALTFDQYMYAMELPEKFLRLVSLMLVDWERPIQTLVNEDSPEYHKQKNKYLKGTYRRPVGALVKKDGKTIMELYSSKSTDATLDYGYYIPEPEILGSGDNSYVWVVSTLKYPCLDQITAETFRSLGEFQKAEIYERKAVRPFYIDPDYARLNPPYGERFNTTNQ